MFILGWTPRGLATASATALLGPRPDSSKFWGRSCPLRPAFGRLLQGGRSDRRHRLIGVGVAFANKYSFVLGGARHQPLIHESCRAWVWGGPRQPASCFKPSLELGAPRAGLRLRPGGEYVGWFALGGNFLNSSQRGDGGGKANCRSFWRRCSSYRPFRPLP